MTVSSLICSIKIRHFVAGQKKQLEEPALSTSVQRKHPYGLNVACSHSNTVERTAWWELLYYLKELTVEPSELDSVLAILASYGVKVKEGLSMEFISTSSLCVCVSV